jgi:RNA ligase (TIGR02306 family)
MQASIQKIKVIKPAKNSDNLELAEVLGWQCVVQKGKFHINQQIVFIEIDSIVPDWPEYEFLKGKYRIKTIKLRGNVSQGLVMAFDDYSKNSTFELYNLSVGHDLSTEFEIKKYEKPAPKCQDAAGSFPDFISKTDEINIQSEPGLLEELKGQKFNVTKKLDGCSMTVYVRNGKFGVCSRNLEIKKGNNLYWNIVKKYQIEKSFENYDNIAIQGEIVGPGIQKNPMGLKEIELYIFDVFDIEIQEYYNNHEMQDFIRRLDKYRERSLWLNVVPRIGIDVIETDLSITELIRYAKEQKYPNGKPAEGLVIRPRENVFSEILRKRLSFKVLNPNYKEN